MDGALWEQEEECLNQIGECRNTSWGSKAGAEFEEVGVTQTQK